MNKCLWNITLAVCVCFFAGCQNSTSVSRVIDSYIVPDVSLAERVQEGLVRSDDPVIAQLHVETSQNNVILSGYVKKIRQSDLAEQIAHRIPGVHQVENRIIVRQ